MSVWRLASAHSHTDNLGPPGSDNGDTPGGVAGAQKCATYVMRVMRVRATPRGADVSDSESFPLRRKKAPSRFVTSDSRFVLRAARAFPLTLALLFRGSGAPTHKSCETRRGLPP